MTDFESRIEIGRFLKELRRGRQQKEVAHQVGYSPSFLSQIETGRMAIPIKDLGKIVKAYGGDDIMGTQKRIIQSLYPGLWEMIEEVASEISGANL